MCLVPMASTGCTGPSYGFCVARILYVPFCKDSSVFVGVIGSDNDGFSTSWVLRVEDVL